MAKAVETFANISATDLLKAVPQLYGWVRKADDSTGFLSVVKKLDGGWPWHYMILRTGCLYLFKKSNSTNFTEAIPLTKYRVCNAPDVTKYSWVFKLVHSTEVKTLFFAVDTEFDLKKWKDAIIKDKEEYTIDAGDYYCEIDDPSDDTTISRAPPPPSPRRLPERPPAPLPAAPLTPARKHSLTLPPDPLTQYKRSIDDPLPPPRSPINPQKKPATLPRPLPAAPETPRRDASPKPSSKDKLRKTFSESCLGPNNFGSVVKQLESTRLSRNNERGTTPLSPPQPPLRPAAGKSDPRGSSRYPPDGCESSKGKHSEVSEAFQEDKTKVSASSALQSKQPGTYLTRPGNSESGKSLSLRDKNEDGTPLIRHYRIFYTEGLGYALDTKGPRFIGISQMLEHYYRQKLPNTETKLRYPYQR